MASPRELLESHPDFRRLLCRYGYVLYDAVDSVDSGYPFYDEWVCQQIGRFRCCVHPDQRAHVLRHEGTDYFLIGHAYNPFDMIHEEGAILTRMARAHSTSEHEFVRLLNQLTGVFTLGYVRDDHLVFFTDAASMQATYYGSVAGVAYVTSHWNIIEDLAGPLVRNAYVSRLTRYRYFRLFGKRLPGDVTPFEQLHRAIPNFRYEYRDGQFTKQRFFPTEAVTECSEAEYPGLVAEVTTLLGNSAELIAAKWKRPGLSLTGGVDSRLTLAAVTGSSDRSSRYQYFSYASSESEWVDARAARSICEHLGLPHTTYEIPEAEALGPDLASFGELLEWSYGSIGPANLNDVRKRLYFSRNDDFDVEVKSWVSEIARAYYSKRFLKHRFPRQPNPRYLTTLYKVFVHDRGLVRSTDQVFARFIAEYLSGEAIEQVNWPDLFFWEHGNEAGHGQVITNEHRVSFDITLPYNNRNLLTLMLTAPLSYRIEDRLHRDVIRRCSPILADIEYVTNVKHTNLRARLERLYLEVHSRVPF